ncbi:MAG: class I SAM-dependent methyltransferase [Gammaproteobacteria bacterium]|nr:class I SAM-dependent methyltransferase [Gammaproteobacteria bacterium]
MTSPLNDPKLEALLDRLHRQSDAEVDETDAYFARRERDGSLTDENFCDADMHRFLSDKMVALDRDKAEFCYLLCRSLGATRIVEAGTSFGVSTLYLAAAVRDNQVDNGVVIGTEHEPHKAEIAARNFAEAGLSKFIYRTPRRRSSADASERWRPGGFHAGRHLGRGSARTRAGLAEPAPRGHRGMR